MGLEKGKPEQNDPLLRTKLFMPTPRNDLIPRPRLIELLHANLHQDDHFHRKLTLIAAPAGYGKTTLASQWLADIDLPVGWLSLEPSENDPTRFLTYLLAALQRVAPHLGEAVQAMLQAPQRPPQEILLTTLINDLTAHRDPILLVLDDYHVIRSQPIHEVLNFLIEHLPPNIHLVITSREDPPLPLHRLQARRQMLGVRQADLSFVEEEVIAYFRDVSQVDLSPEHAAMLTRRTEGWVTGLQLAALSMKSAQDRDSFIESFTGSNRYVLDYLFEEVFDTQPEKMKSFLLHTAILNRICANLADTVTRRDDSQILLEQLEHANFFIVPLDQARQWYRYHRLFVDLLRHRLSKSMLNVAELHERASRWYAEQDSFEEAIEHALAGGHWELAGEWIDQASDQTLRRGEVLTLLTWCRRMPEEVLLSRPEWALTFAWPLILIGEVEQADRVLQHIKGNLPSDNRPLRGRVLAAEAFLSRTSGEIAKTIELSKQALEYLPEDDRSSRGNLAVNLGLITWHIGQLDEAEKALKEALLDTQATRNHYSHHTAQVFLARTHASRGDLTSAITHLKKALTMGDRVPTAVLAHTDLAAIHFERNQLESAWEHLERAYVIAEAIHNQEFHTACAVQRALFHLRLGEVKAAQSAIEPALAIQRTQELPILTDARLKACQIQIALAEGDLATARKIQTSISIPHDAHTFCRFIDLNTARIHLAAGERDQARLALQAASEYAEAAGWRYALYVIRVMQSLQAEDIETAIPILQPALQTAEIQGLIRVFLQESDQILGILREAARRGICPGYIGEILAVVEEQVPAPSSYEALPEPLTKRELEVLRLIAAGRSNRQIAEQLVVSLGTAKSHIHHIFGKLDVSSRTEAAARARNLNLI
jgi:LuxR family maltose regulon positive regulatory protein